MENCETCNRLDCDINHSKELDEDLDYLEWYAFGGDEPSPRERKGSE